jgi:hypothetical protein
MKNLYYRLAKVEDPEETIEDAAMFKALYDEFGAGLTVVPRDKPAPKDGLFLGRGKRNEFFTKPFAKETIRYWEDQAFRESISRQFLVTDLEGAEKEVERLHAEGKDAFLKSTKTKEMVGKAPCGKSFTDALGDWIWSFIDKPDCLMVQERVDMSYERRFMVMNGKVVTQSPVAWHLTPLSRSHVYDETGFNVEDLHYPTPDSREARYSPAGTHRMTCFAQDIADRSIYDHFCIDLAILGDNPEKDPIEIIEYNPMQPGGVGLFACSPYKIAAAVREALSPELLAIVEARQAGEIPPGEPPMGEHNEEPEESSDGFMVSFDQDWNDDDEAPEP